MNFEYLFIKFFELIYYGEIIKLSKIDYVLLKILNYTGSFINNSCRKTIFLNL